MLKTMIVAALIAGPALAQEPTVAHLSGVQGSVLINQGAGFAPAAANAVLHKGDRVLTVKGGKTRLVYSNGCQVAVTGGHAVSVGSGAASCARAADTDKTAEDGGIDKGAVLPILLGVGVVAGVAIVASNNSKTTSP